MHEFDWQGRGGAFSWHASNSKGLFREQDRLVSVDFDTKQRFMLKLSPNPMLASFSVLTPNQLFYSEFGGEKYILKRWQAPFEPDANRNQVILESDGSNYYPNLHDNKVAFVSNRGRSRQYWLSQNDSVIQISDFSNEQVNVLGPPSLSNSGELVLYRRDDSLEILDIKTRAIRQLTDIPGKFVNSAVFGKGDTKLYYSLTTEQIIQIWEYDLITQQTKQLTKDSAYHVVKDGLGNAYYIREQELIGLTNPDFRLTLPNHFNRCFCAISLSDNYIYTTDRNDYMYRTSLRDGTSEQFKLVEPIVGLQVTNDDESVILTVKKAADTQIKRLSW